MQDKNNKDVVDLDPRKGQGKTADYADFGSGLIAAPASMNPLRLAPHTAVS
jgi:hypothetical protein